MSVLAKPILLILSTSQIATHGYLITPIVAVGGVFYGLYGIITQIIVLENRTKLTGNIWIIAALANIVLAIILGYGFGIIGVAVSTLVVYVMAFLLTSHYAFKFIRCNFYYRFILKAVSCSVAITILLVTMNPHGYIGIFLSILIAFGAYMVLMLLVGGIRPYEITFFMDMFKESFIKYKNKII